MGKNERPSGVGGVMAKILITGGLGFIGSHLVDFLLEENSHEITVIDNLCSESSSRDYMREEVDYYIEDIRNLDSLKIENNFEIIFHLAALARIQPSFKDPLKYFSIDAYGTNQVLELARECNAKLVYAGSSSAFGGPKLNPYAFAKFIGEELCDLYSKIYNVSTVTARFFNVYGGRQPVSGPYATVIGIFENQYKSGAPITVTGDGNQKRDFTHVSDIISGLVSLSKNKWNGDMFQLGTGVNYSINEIANLFSDNIIYIPKRLGEAETTLADIGPINFSTGWSSKINLKDYIINFKNAQK